MHRYVRGATVHSRGRQCWRLSAAEERMRAMQLSPAAHETQPHVRHLDLCWLQFWDSLCLALRTHSTGYTVSSLTRWLDPVAAHRGWPKVFSVRKLPASETAPIKATHALESNQGATLVSGYPGAFVAACWPMTFLSSILGTGTVTTSLGSSCCYLSVSAKSWPLQQSYQRITAFRLSIIAAYTVGKPHGSWGGKIYLIRA